MALTFAINLTFLLLIGLAAYASGHLNDRVVRGGIGGGGSGLTCPPVVDYSHPDFVCPPEVLARRRVMPGNHTLAYQRLGDASQFRSQFWEDWFLYSEFFYHEGYDWGSRKHDNASNIDGEATASHPTFIELGGYDGTTGSNSYFYDKKLGWRGLLLEASTPNYALMEQSRLSSRVATVHGAVCDAPRLLTLWGGQSLTTNNRQEANNLFHGDQQSISVCLPMPAYMRMFDHGWHNTTTSPRHIDYFSIDVEGQELEVILSHDWVRWPVFVVTVEVAVQPLLSGTAAYQHAKRCALRERGGMCRWPFYDSFKPPVPHDEAEFSEMRHPSRNNEVWINPALLGQSQDTR